jgi:hypothetical protein
MCHVTIQKQKELAEAAAQQSQPKQVMHTASYHSPYIPEYVGNHPAALVLQQVNPKHLGNSFHRHHQYNEVRSQKGASTLTPRGTSERSPKLAQSTALCQSRSTFTDKISYLDSSFLHFRIQFYFLCSKEQLWEV